MKIAIIGAGVTGLITAYIVAKRLPDFEIEIFDKEEDPRIKERNSPNPSWGIGSSKSVRHLTGSECVSLEADDALISQAPKLKVDNHNRGMDSANKAHSATNHDGLAKWLDLIKSDSDLANFFYGEGMIPIYSVDEESLAESVKWEKDLYSGQRHGLPKPRVSVDQTCSKVFSDSILTSKNVEVPGIWTDLKGMLTFILDWLDSYSNASLKFNQEYCYENFEFDRYDFVIDASSAGKEFIKLNGLWVTVKNKVNLKKACKLALPLPFGYINITPLRGYLELSGGLWFGESDEIGFRKMLIKYLNPILNEDLMAATFSECARPFHLPYGIPIFKKINKKTIMIGGGSKAGCIHAPFLADKVIDFMS